MEEVQATDIGEQAILRHFIQSVGGLARDMVIVPRMRGVTQIIVPQEQTIQVMDTGRAVII